MHITRLIIQNFRCIESFEADFSDHANIFCGVNGAGKTTILQAIEILFSWFSARLKNKKGNGTTLRDEDIRHGAEECLLKIILDDGTEWSLHRQHSMVRKQTESKSDLKKLTEKVNDIAENAWRDENYPIPVFTSFSVHRRAVANLPKRIHKKNELGKFEIYPTKVDGKPQTQAFFIWFKEREDIENEKYRRQSDDFPDSQLDTVRRVFSNIPGGYSNLRIERPKGFVIDKNNHSFSFEQLSDGEKSYIMLVADIARLLAMATPSTQGQDPLEASGIILIDELDLHLHPEWQRQILPGLLKSFPKCQFIITTHSPYIISSLQPQNKLFSITENGITPISENTYGSEVSDILQRILGLSSLRDIQIERDIEAIWESIRTPNTNEQELNASINKLRESLNPNDHIFLKIALERKLHSIKQQR